MTMTMTMTLTLTLDSQNLSTARQGQQVRRVACMHVLDNVSLCARRSASFPHPCRRSLGLRCRGTAGCGLAPVNGHPQAPGPVVF